MLRAAAVLAVGALLYLPGQGHAQLGGGVGGIGLQGLNGNGLGAPPAGVGLHQQYMQLYGLPVNFTQGSTNNGGSTGIFPGGGFGGGLGGRLYGVNYQRQRLAAQYLQMVRYQQQQQLLYGQNAYPTQPTAGTSAAPTGGFGMSQGSSSQQQPYFSTTPTAASTQFRGFGLASTISSPLPVTKREEDKKEEKKEQKDQDKDKQ